MNKLATVTAALLLSFFCATVIASEENDDKMSVASTDEYVTSCEKQYSADVYPDAEERNVLVDQCINEKEEANQNSGTN